MTLPNIIEIQEELKNQPDNILMREMQMPTGNMPQFLVLGELKRRKSMRDDYQRRQNSDMKTVAEEVVTGAGVPQEGIMGVAKNMAPKTNVAQNTGIAQATPVTPTQAPQPQMMADGGIIRLREGGKPTPFQRLKEYLAGVREESPISTRDLMSPPMYDMTGFGNTSVREESPISTRDLMSPPMYDMTGFGNTSIDERSGLERFEDEQASVKDSPELLRAEVARLGRAGQRAAEIANYLGRPVQEILDVGLGIVADGTVGVGALAADLTAVVQGAVVNNPESAKFYANVAKNLRKFGDDSYYNEGDALPRISNIMPKPETEEEKKAAIAIESAGNYFDTLNEDIRAPLVRDTGESTLLQGQAGPIPTAKGTIDATGIEGKMLPPPRSSDALPSTASIDPFRSYDLNLDGTTSLPDAPAMPSVGGIGDIIRQNEMRRMQGLDPVEDGYTPLEEAKRKLLADESNVGFIDAVGIEKEGDAEYITKKAMQSYRPEAYADRDRDYRFLFGENSIGEIISGKASDYYNRDLTTPREEVYSTLLGGSNSGQALSGAGQSELDRIADAQYKDKMANEIAEQQGFFADQDKQADKKYFDEAAADLRERNLGFPIAEPPSSIMENIATGIASLNKPELTPKELSEQRAMSYDNSLTRGALATQAQNENNVRNAADLIGGKIASDQPETLSSTEKAATDAKKALRKRLDNPIPSPTTPSVVGGASSATAQEAAAQKNFSTDKWMALAMIGAGLSSGRPDDVGKSVKSGIEYLQKSKQGKMAYDAKMKQIDATLQAARVRGGQTGIRNDMLRAKYYQDQAEILRKELQFVPKEDQQSVTYIDAVNRIAELDEIARRLMGGDVVVKKGSVLSDGPERNKVG